MTVPVLKAFANQNPNVELIMVSNKKFKALFEDVPNLEFYGVDLKNYKGVLGLYKLFSELKQFKATHLIDLHNVLRTKILKLFFRSTSIKINTLEKGREEKKELTQKKYKKLKQLKTMHERYADVFREAGFTLDLPKNKIKLKKDIQNIGIAPFARYSEKMYPIEKMKKVALELAKSGKNIVLFGGGDSEISELKTWEKLHSNITSLAGTLSLKGELEKIKELDVLVSMDSANMHLASLLEIPCLSIWGSTHRYAGFLGFNQSEENVIEVNLECRPCSIFGNKTCFRGDLMCMNSIREEEVISKLV